MAMIAVIMAVSAFSQTIMPPIAEYHKRADGVVELRNDSDDPMAVIVEVKGFQVDENGGMRYVPLDPSVKVEFGSNSFIIPPHQSHMVFYKSDSKKTPYWFAILNTFTKAAPVKGTFRVNMILPHIVYVYQKQSLKKKDIELALTPGQKPDTYRLQIKNLTDKAGRVQGVDCKDFEKKYEGGGLPVFPNQSRYLTLDTGRPNGAKAHCTVTFEQGFSLNVSPSATTQ